MKVFALFVLCLTILLFIVVPGIEEYNKFKDISRKKALLHAFVPLLYYVGLLTVGFILFEIMPCIVGPVLENIF